MFSSAAHSFFMSLPKAELHCHLDGSLRPHTLLDLARRSHMLLPFDSIENMRQFLGIGTIRRSLEHYLQAFVYTLAVLQKEEAIERVAYELVEDAAQENILYLEIRFCPQLNTERGLSLHQVISAALRGIKKGDDIFKTVTRLIICGLKNYSPQQNMAIAQAAVAFKDDGVVAFDLAGPEQGFPITPHRQALLIAQQAGLHITLHAGESEKAWSVAEALTCGAQRIGHGTSLIEDPLLMRQVIDKAITLEVCLQSNLETQAIQAIAKHPLLTYLNQGVKVSLNTDNRLMAGIQLSDEYFLAWQHFSLNWQQIKTIVLNGFHGAFVDIGEKNVLLKMAQQKVEQMACHFPT